MKFAVALFAVTFMAQSCSPALAQSAQLDEIANLPVIDGATSVTALGGEGAHGVKMQFTDQQKEKFYELKNKLLNESGPKRLALSQQKRQLKDLLTKENLDKKAIQETQDKINSLRTELANVQIAFRLEMQEQLTPDQRKTMRYRSMRAGGKHKMKHHKGGHKRFRANEESENTIGSDSMFSPEGITAANI